MKIPEAPHSQTAEEVLAALESSADGLTEEEARRRLAEFGRNVLKEEKVSKFEIFARQFKNVLVYVLLAAALLTAVLNEWQDFAMIIAIIAINGIIGFWQEIRAEASLSALKKLTESRAAVIRGGVKVSIPSSDLVPGDIVIVGEGDVASADIRLIWGAGLMVDESIITGESIPDAKEHDKLFDPDTPPFDQENMILSGTTVVRGSGHGVVVRTGHMTYLASIAEKGKESSPDSPLTRAIASFSKRYVATLMALFAVVAAVGFAQGRELADLIYLLVAQLVSALPEGLPLVVTLVMVVGAMTLSRRKTLTRHLPAVETLGSATVIASDKTGTITEGKLRVSEEEADRPERLRLIAALCNDSDGTTGDPIDLALAEWIGRGEYSRLREENARVWEYPFDTKLRLMASANEVGGARRLFVKGAFDELAKKDPDKDRAARLGKAQDRMASRGLRVLAFAEGEFSSEDPSQWRLELCGIVGFLDPPKEGVRDAILTAKKAGIRILMITGDYPLTAKAIAQAVGLWEEGDRVLLGKEIEALPEGELYSALKGASVLARVLPETKYKVVRALQQRGEVVAVTGDGVNDVPALKAADLGIAMGSGSEAAKNVAKMVITDNNLSVIVQAIETGRVIADNIRKVIYYLISTGLHQIFLISFAIFAGLPMPLLPIQILWENIVTDGTQDKMFAFAKAEGDVMSRKPREAKGQFFDRRQIARVFFFGLPMGIINFLGFWYLLGIYPYVEVVSITFTAVVFSQWVNGILSQKENAPFIKDIRSSLTINKYIFAGTAVGIALQLLAIYAVPGWFRIVPLEAGHWVWVALLCAATFAIVEARKWIEFLIERRNERAV
ncbi:MAG: cation-transporting P-type ATPase [Candidatus Methanosuratus sp.]|nr:cation-transporting P-type ATPase [Candidatus Methanosuratincola sp.]